MAMKRNWMYVRPTMGTWCPSLTRQVRQAGKPDVLTRLAAWAAIVAAATVGGCGPATMPLGRVSGKVSVHGQPVAGGRIYFVPEQGPGAAGLIDSNGQYQLTTRTAGDGAVLGKHRVFFGPPPPPRVKVPEPVGPPPPVVQTFPPVKYRTPETSGLTAEVHAGNNDLDFDLKIDREIQK